MTRCSLKCSMYLFYVFLHMFHVFYMYFFKCSIYFYVFLHSFHVQCILYVFLHMFKYFHVFLNSFHFFLCVPSHVPCIFYVFLHRFHVFLDMFTKACKSFSLSFLQQNNNLNGTRNHNLSCDLCALFLFNHCLQRKKKKESSGYLTKHTTEMDILVDVIIFS